MKNALNDMLLPAPNKQHKEKIVIKTINQGKAAENDGGTKGGVKHN